MHGFIAGIVFTLLAVGGFIIINIKMPADDWLEGRGYTITPEKPLTTAPELNDPLFERRWDYLKSVHQELASKYKNVDFGERYEGLNLKKFKDGRRPNPGGWQWLRYVDAMTYVLWVGQIEGRVAITFDNRRNWCYLVRGTEYESVYEMEQRAVV